MHRLSSKYKEFTNIKLAQIYPTYPIITYLRTAHHKCIYSSNSVTKHGIQRCRICIIYQITTIEDAYTYYNQQF